MINERAIIVALSYIIGFVTAFIAFGIPETSKVEKGYSSAEIQPLLSVPERDINLTASSFEAFKNETGLFVNVDGDERIISAHVLTNEGEPGYHFDIPYYATSPNMQFVHYCEQMTEVPTECMHFVYVVDMHTVYPVKANGEQIVSEISDMEAEWGADGKLMINAAISADVSKPWMLN